MLQGLYIRVDEFGGGVVGPPSSSALAMRFVALDGRTVMVRVGLWHVPEPECGVRYFRVKIHKKARQKWAGSIVVERMIGRD